MFWVKWSKKPGWLAANWKKNFSRCNNAGNNKILRQTNQNMLFMLYSWFRRVLATKKQKRFLLVMYSSRKPNLLVNKAKHVFGAMKGWSSAFCNDKVKLLSFCDIRLEPSNLVAKKTKHVFGKRERQKCSLVTKQRKWLLSKR